MNQERKLTVFGALNAVGGVSGLLSLALIIWSGGAMWQQVHDHDRRLNNIEVGGSIGLREHVKLDDERVRELQERLVQDREIQKKLLDRLEEVSSDVKVIKVQIESMKQPNSQKP